MSKRVCIFVDGENLRHSICDLFQEFNEFDYLPKSANWTAFFYWIAKEVTDDKPERVRTYWYVVENIDFSPFELNRARKDIVSLTNILSKRQKIQEELSRTSSKDEKIKILNEIADDLEEREHQMQKRFSGWTNIQGGIESNHKSVEFRRAGSIRYNLYEQSLGSEKCVDLKLATDLVRLKDIYDIAVIVSGDQDYVPAVDAIKDFGKHVVNVFRSE